MKFHVIVGAILCISGYLVYALLFGLHSDLENARQQIQIESVKSLREDKKIRANDQYAGYINQTLVQPEPKPLAQKAEAPVSRTEEAPVLPPAEAEERYLGEKNFWCKPVPVRLETNPVKCLYSDSCYGCDGPIIRPDFDGVVPLCANGQRSQLFHVECCPNFMHGVAECPSSEECFRADNVPKDFCSCNNRPECHLASIGSSIQCACSDN
jgi:hypothetical protein